MPSIAAYVNEILTEDMYGHEFNSKIEQRVENYNVAQLNGINKHISKIADGSKFQIWRDANTHIKSKISTTLQIRNEIKEKEIKRREEEKFKLIQRDQKKRAKKVEAIRVMKSIVKITKEKAIIEVKEEERIRQTVDKADVIDKINRADIKKWRYLRYLALAFAISISLICYFVSNVDILAPVIVLLVLISTYLSWKFYNMTNILPIELSEVELNSKISERQIKLKNEAIENLREKELNFQEKLLRDKIDRRIRRIQRKAEAKAKEKLLEEQQLAWERQQLEMASKLLTNEQNMLILKEKEAEIPIVENLENVKENLRFYISHILFTPMTDLVSWNMPLYATISLSSADHVPILQSQTLQLIGKDVLFSFNNKHNETMGFSILQQISQKIEIQSLVDFKEKLDDLFRNCPRIVIKINENLVIKVFTIAKYNKTILLGEIRLSCDFIRKTCLDMHCDQSISQTLDSKVPSGEVILNLPLHGISSSPSDQPRGSISITGYDFDVCNAFLSSCEESTQSLTSEDLTNLPLSGEFQEFDAHNLATPETPGLKNMPNFGGKSGHSPKHSLQSASRDVNDTHEEKFSNSNEDDSNTLSQQIRLLRIVLSNFNDGCRSYFNETFVESVPTRLFMSLEINGKDKIFGHSDLFSFTSSVVGLEVDIKYLKQSSFCELSSNDEINVEVFLLSSNDKNTNFRDFGNIGEAEMKNEGIRLIQMGTCTLFGDEILLQFLRNTNNELANGTGEGAEGIIELTTSLISTHPNEVISDIKLFIQKQSDLLLISDLKNSIWTI